MSKNIDEVLEAFAKRIESMPRGKTYDWEAEKQAILTDLLELKPLTTVDGPVNVWEQRIKNYIQGA